MKYNPYVKRCMDLLIASSLLIILAPLFLLLMLIIRFKLGQHVFFTQQRGGLNGKRFHIIKFRTMLDRYDDQGELLPDDQRLTVLGALLRRFSLDELPALLNVIRGEMSLVGPRPLMSEYLEYYNAFEKQRHEVLPGITGWAQINGRNAISWSQKFSFDVWYVKHASFWLDIKILLLTIQKVFKREGITAEGHVTTDKFQGT